MCSWDGYLGRLRQDMGQEVSLPQTLLRGIVKTESWFCDFLWQWSLVLCCGKLKLGRGRKRIQAIYVGAPQRPPFPAAAKLISEKDPGSTTQGRQAGPAATWKAQTIFWRHSDFLNWLARALGLRSLKGRVEASEKETRGKCPLRCLASVFTLKFWAYVKSMG